MNALRRRFDLRASVAIAAVGLLALAATATADDWLSDFDGLFGSAAGVPLTGQDGFYIPTGTTSVDFLVYTYAGNALGMPVNPTGGTMFIGGTGPGSSTYARAQRDLAVDEACLYEIAYDFCANTTAGSAATNNVGSFSGQPLATGEWIQLMSWVPGFEGTLYRAFFMYYDAGGAQVPAPGEAPGPAWDNLEVNHWYRHEYLVDFAQNLIVEVTIIDLMTSATTTVNPIGWYLEGGAAGSTQPMTGFRFFGGGSVEGNSLAFDNAVIRCGITTPVQPSTWGDIKSHYR